MEDSENDDDFVSAAQRLKRKLQTYIAKRKSDRGEREERSKGLWV
jgi:hypothetical protein